MLTQDQKQKFIACLEQKMKVKLVFQWEDFLYFQYIGCSETAVRPLTLRVQKIRLGFPWKNCRFW